MDNFDGTNAPEESSVIGASPATPGQGSAFFSDAKNLGYPTTCQVPPTIRSIQLVNDGGQAWGAEVNGYYFVGYKSDPENTDIIGNYSFDAVTWTPGLSGTDPPSHFLFAKKEFSSDCAFYPAFDSYNGLFAMAWLETQPTGRLDLKYTDVNQGPFLPPPGPPTTNPPGTAVGQNTFYVYPRITSVGSLEHTENIPLSNVTVVDTAGNTFKIDSTESVHRGVELTMPHPVRSFYWTQAFRQPTNAVIGTLTTIPTQENDFTTSPIPGLVMNVYRGHGTNFFFKRLTTDEKGFYEVQLLNQEYTFEVISQSLSINVSQRIL